MKFYDSCLFSYYCETSRFSVSSWIGISEGASGFGEFKGVAGKASTLSFRPLCNKFIIVSIDSSKLTFFGRPRP